MFKRYKLTWYRIRHYLQYEPIGGYYEDNLMNGGPIIRSGDYLGGDTFNCSGEACKIVGSRFQFGPFSYDSWWYYKDQAHTDGIPIRWFAIKWFGGQEFGVGYSKNMRPTVNGKRRSGFNTYHLKWERIR